VDNGEIQAVAVSVLCNISNNELVKKILTEINAPQILIQLLQSSIDDIQSRVAIVLADLAVYGPNQSGIAAARRHSVANPLVGLGRGRRVGQCGQCHSRIVSEESGQSDDCRPRRRH
jgi:hypothetical protein